MSDVEKVRISLYLCTKFKRTRFFMFNGLKFTFLFALLGLVFGSIPAAAEPSNAHQKESSNFKPGDFIMHHIADAHEIHFFTLNEGTADEKHFSIYLPIIVKTEAGWEVFSSSHFYHNENSINTPKGHEHYYANPEHKMVMFHEKIYTSQDGLLKINAEGHPDHDVHQEVLDLSITKSVFGFLMVGLITILIFVSVANSYKKNAGKAPKGLQSFLEPLILFIRDEVAKPSVGHHYEKFTPFLLSTFFFIFLMNLLGLIPFLGGFNITGTLGVTAVLATVVFIITTINGNGHYWGHILWPPGVPGFVKVILIPIEILGIFIKPFVLMVRITANITAGHIIILSFVSLIFIFGQTSAAAGYGIGVGSLAFMIFMNFIELLVAFLQAYVFTLLAALYFGSATEEVHH